MPATVPRMSTIAIITVHQYCGILSCARNPAAPESQNPKHAFQPAHENPSEKRGRPPRSDDRSCFPPRLLGDLANRRRIALPASALLTAFRHREGSPLVGRRCRLGWMTPPLPAVTCLPYFFQPPRLRRPPRQAFGGGRVPRGAVRETFWEPLLGTTPAGLQQPRHPTSSGCWRVLRRAICRSGFKATWPRGKRGEYGQAGK